MSTRRSKRALPDPIEPLWTNTTDEVMRCPFPPVVSKDLEARGLRGELFGAGMGPLWFLLCTHCAQHDQNPPAVLSETIVDALVARLRGDAQAQQALVTCYVLGGYSTAFAYLREFLPKALRVA